MNRTLKLAIIREFGTQADFSMAIREDESIVSRVIRGRRSLSSEKKKEWAKVLKSKPQELFGTEGKS
ncbi:MAG: XRE family transcriptional regulator [Desulfobacteraceae bacterium]|nr:MAG: XRE family transcriptional regulator [Desulfobacteraceae bacterium]